MNYPAHDLDALFHPVFKIVSQLLPADQPRSSLAKFMALMEENPRHLHHGGDSGDRKACRENM